MVVRIHRHIVETMVDVYKRQVRYNSLTRSFPDRAEALFAKAEQNAADRYEHLLRLGSLYGKK